MIGNLFNTIFYAPLLNILLWIYDNVISDFGVAIIILTIIIRLVLLPLFYKSAKDQTIIQKISPKIKEAQELHKHDRVKQAEEVMKIYKEHKVNPFSGFLLIIIQLPILIALYRVFLNGMSEKSMKFLYSWVEAPSALDQSFLGLIDLGSRNMILIIAAGIMQYLQSAFMMRANKKNSQKSGGELSVMERVNKNMMVMGPLFTVFILYSLPSAVALYWLTTSVFSVIQQIVINKKVMANDANKN